MHGSQSSISGSHLTLVSLDPLALDGSLGSHSHVDLQFLLQLADHGLVGSYHGLHAEIRDSHENDGFGLFAVFSDLYFLHIID